ncbi:SARP family transcriptional regulator [Sulfitobacter sp. M72]|uniref:BTAD domain-containing putative transcriptional regulator n=1 Tax=unclassified Sulfitobacter TaxID=196795 RepID=UPI0023E10CA1|nr:MULTISPECIES: BTAD domain-containing putative transcriptional regulator [unclassified Sulfitobacter]MDF3414420.1 SARP family transcriptional regulator [Sulfitobacter sp. KE5]MDF3421901.1 SARP family transcriptional regulator [Sulfitobacter sp. KE43]MDF3489650.1 SARP family transcriptional regulator [Sulfitobacter sp. M60]MDF3501364.1 SARP family transcriptional regulator [Sulfitobacter sp. Ks17]MDF3432966.1 SARP family transcriptional regulator [Sulfitobacter sp. KE42]
MLLYLISTPGRFYRNEMITQLLWDGAGETKAANSFRQAVRQIRLESENVIALTLITRSSTIGFEMPDDRPIEVALATQIGSSVGDSDAFQDVREYISILDALLGVSTPFDSWLAFARAQTLKKVQEVMDAIIVDSDNQAARWAAQCSLELEPSNETAARFIMRDLWQSGSATRAIATYNELYAYLDQFFDQEPDAETIDLLAAIKLDPEGQRSNMDRGPAKPRITLEVVEEEEPPNKSHDASLQAVLTSDLRMRLGRFREWEIQPNDTATAPFLSIKCRLHSIEDARYLSVDVHRSSPRTVVWSEMIESPNIDWTRKVRMLVVNIANALSVVVSHRKHHDTNASVYDKWLESQTLIGTWQLQDEEEAIRLLHEVTIAAPDFGPAHAELAGVLNVRHILRPGTRHTEDAMLSALDHALEAVASDPMDTRAHRVLAWCYCHSGKFDMAEFHFEQSLLLNSQNAMTLASAALGFAFSGNMLRAQELIVEVEQLPRAMEPFQLIYLAASNFLCGNHAVAVEQCAQGQGLMSTVGGWHAAALMLTGQPEAARERLDSYVVEIAGQWCGQGAPNAKAVIDWFASCFPLRSEAVREELHATLLSVYTQN